MPRLKRLSDDVGDCGSMSYAIRWEDNGKFKEIAGERPIVGCSMMVGSERARTMNKQDYWLTTVVTEILEDTLDYVKFRTKNSIYEWNRM